LHLVLPAGEMLREARDHRHAARPEDDVVDLAEVGTADLEACASGLEGLSLTAVA